MERYGNGEMSDLRGLLSVKRKGHDLVYMKERDGGLWMAQVRA
jgi:hypothetical protein